MPSNRQAALYDMAVNIYSEAIAACQAQKNLADGLQAYLDYQEAQLRTAWLINTNRMDLANAKERALDELQTYLAHYRQMLMALAGDNYHMAEQAKALAAVLADDGEPRECLDCRLQTEFIIRPMVQFQSGDAHIAERSSPWTITAGGTPRRDLFGNPGVLTAVVKSADLNVLIHRNYRCFSFSFSVQRIQTFSLRFQRVHESHEL